MGRSLRSKRGKALRATMRKEVNGPVEKKLQGDVLWRLKQKLKSSTATPSLMGLGAALHGGSQADIAAAAAAASGDVDHGKQGRVWIDRSKDGAPAVDPTAIVLNDPIEEGRQDQARDPIARPFAFVERTWQLEEKPEDADEVTSFADIPNPQARDAAVINPGDLIPGLWGQHTTLPHQDLGELDLDAMMEDEDEDGSGGRAKNPRHRTPKVMPRTQASRNGLSGFSHRDSSRPKIERSNYKKNGERHTHTKKPTKEQKIQRRKARAAKNRALGSMG